MNTRILAAKQPHVVTFKVTVGGVTTDERSVTFDAKDADDAEEVFWNEVRRLNLIGIVHGVNAVEVKP